jgi:hypothetical protein
MTHKHYKTLSQEEKYKNLLSSGLYLISREKEESHVLLFQLYDFYVEVYTDHNCNKVAYIRSFKNTYELYPYLENIDISGIFF